MLLNAFDVDPGADERTLELQAGELHDLGLKADLLVVSARQGSYEPLPGTLIHSLEHQFGIKTAHLPKTLDMRSSDIAAWVSPPLTELPQRPSWPVASSTRFSRIAVVESPCSVQDALERPWPVFRQLFSLLAVLPLQGIDCPVVATPLLSAGNQAVAPERLFPDLLSCCRSGFRHVPDLERLIVFDRRQKPLELLAERIDLELGRSPGDRDVVPLGDLDRLRVELLGLLRGFGRLHPQLVADVDLSELSHLLASDQVTPVALGMHSRRLVERMVRHHLGWRRGGLYQGLQALQRRDLSPWLLSCLHQVRVFGNWMGHPSPPEKRQSVTPVDLATMLAALHRVLESYPWR
jgi:hypothetical protein